MTTESWVEATGVPLPKCKMQGCCCRAASPSIPFHQLLEKASKGDDFARNFFSIFVPHKDHATARQIVPGLVERTLKAAAKDKNFKDESDVVFYQCRYIGEDNKCTIWEDRPELCRAYPDSPFMVFAPGCAFEPWAEKVKEKFSKMQAELEELKTLRENLKELQSIPQTTMTDPLLEAAGKETLALVLQLTPSYLSSPLISSLK